MHQWSLADDQLRRQRRLAGCMSALQFIAVLGGAAAYRQHDNKNIEHEGIE
jgi:hypothetical protein